jgi:hypothetical protein
MLPVQLATKLNINIRAEFGFFDLGDYQMTGVVPRIGSQIYEGGKNRWRHFEESLIDGVELGSNLRHLGCQLPMINALLWSRHKFRALSDPQPLRSMGPRSPSAARSGTPASVEYRSARPSGRA